MIFCGGETTCCARSSRACSEAQAAAVTAHANGGTMAMLISTATIDCWLYVSANNYFDFQHHHWNIGPNHGGTITTAVGNRSDYTWTLSGGGHDSNGSWSAISQSATFNQEAQVRINTPSTVSLTQTVLFGTNNLKATGSSKVTDHPVPEPTWPTDLTWSPSAGTPSSITARDMGQPTYQLVTTPYAVPRSPPRSPPRWCCWKE
jgi:hypothetical protein